MPQTVLKNCCLFYFIYFQNGYLEITPGLSEVLDENYSEINSQMALAADKTEAINASLSDATVINGVMKGFRLSTFRYEN